MVPDDGGSDDDEAPGQVDPPETGVSTRDGDVVIDPAVLELDHVFSVLSHPRRRYLMYALAENPEWTLHELATKLVAWEEDLGEAVVDPYRRDRMYISLYHTHVPKLVDEGVVEYDSEAETIARGENAEQVFAVLAGAGGSLDIAQEAHASRAYERASETE